MNKARRTSVIGTVLETGFIADALFRPDRFIIYFVMLLAELITPLSWSARRRDLLSSSTRFCGVSAAFSPGSSLHRGCRIRRCCCAQRILIPDLVMALKCVEMFSPATFRIFLDRRPGCKVRRASLGLKRSVRVLAFIGFSSLTR